MVPYGLKKIGLLYGFLQHNWHWHLYWLNKWNNMHSSDNLCRFVRLQPWWFYVSKKVFRNLKWSHSQFINIHMFEIAALTIEFSALNAIIYIVVSYMPSDHFCELQENYGVENILLLCFSSRDTAFHWWKLKTLKIKM